MHDNLLPLQSCFRGILILVLICFNFWVILYSCIIFSFCLYINKPENVLRTLSRLKFSLFLYNEKLSKNITILLAVLQILTSGPKLQETCACAKVSSFSLDDVTSYFSLFACWLFSESSADTEIYFTTVHFILHQAPGLEAVCTCGWTCFLRIFSQVVVAGLSFQIIVYQRSQDIRLSLKYSYPGLSMAYSLLLSEQPLDSVGSAIRLDPINS